MRVGVLGAGGIAGLGVGSGLHEEADIFLLQVHAGQHERGEPVIISGVHRGPGGNQLLHGSAVVAFAMIRSTPSDTNFVAMVVQFVCSP